MFNPIAPEILYTYLLSKPKCSENEFTEWQAVPI